MQRECKMMNSCSFPLPFFFSNPPFSSGEVMPHIRNVESAGRCWSTTNGFNDARHMWTARHARVNAFVRMHTSPRQLARHACFSLYLLSISYLSISLLRFFLLLFLHVPLPFSPLSFILLYVRGRVPFLGLCNCARGHLSIHVWYRERVQRALVVAPARVGFGRVNVRSNTLCFKYRGESGRDSAASSACFAFVKFTLPKWQKCNKYIRKT